MRRDQFVQVSVRRELGDRLQVAADDRGLSRTKLCELLLNDGYDRLIPVEELRLTYRSAPDSPPRDSGRGYGPGGVVHRIVLIDAVGAFATACQPRVEVGWVIDWTVEPVDCAACLRCP